MSDNYSDASTSGKPSKFEMLSKTLSSPFTSHRTDATKIFSELAPVIMTPRMVNAAVNSRANRGTLAGTSNRPSALTTLTRRLTSNPTDAVIANSILELDVPEEEVVGVSLLRGYQATNPLAGKSRLRRRDVRAAVIESDRGVSSISRKRLKGSVHGRERSLPQEELTRQTNEIVRDKENIAIRRTVLTSEIEEVTKKLEKLEAVRQLLESDLLKLTEEELELEDELDGVLNTISHSSSRPATLTRQSTYSSSQRRRKGPAFLPSEHDSLPSGVAFMTLMHPRPIQALDFSAPYEMMVSSSSGSSDYALHIWDLSNGTEVRRLLGHTGPVKAIQVEDTLCVTGGDEGTLRLWDLTKMSEWEEIETTATEDREVEEMADEFGQMNWSNVKEGRRSPSKSVQNSSASTSQALARDDPSCMRVLEGHSRGITALYFENECLVTGASDKTIRQWDLNTGQCVMTMDILWAITNTQPTPSRRRSSRHSMAPYNAASLAGYAPGYEDHEDFVGGVQFWGYALISGSADGGVRMWDMRTGEAHRTLLGHTGPVTCLQFDESYVVTGSVDKTIRIWDLRTGGVAETLQFDHGISDLQFDSRKIVACCGENSVKIYNRTSQQITPLVTNGHLQPASKARYIDRYMLSGGMDSTVKVWAL